MVYGARLDLENPTIALPQTLVPGNFWLLLRDSKGAVMATASMLLRH